MGFLSSLVKTAVNVALTPVAVVADIVTLGEAEATATQAKKIVKNTEKAFDKLSEGKLL